MAADGPPLRVRTITTGAVRAKRAVRGPRRYLPGGWSDATLPVHCHVVEHPAGLLLFDAGQSAAAMRPGYHQRWHPFLRLARFELDAAQEAAPQLRSLGLRPEDVRWVCLSHLHTDHVGGLAAFAAAEVLVADGEWRRASGCRGRLRGYIPQHWPAGVVPRRVHLEGPAVGPFPATFDVAGDGLARLVPLPGHTPDHLGLLVRDGPGGWLLAGDLAHRAQDVEQLDPGLAAWCRSEGIVILTAHDPGQEPGLPLR